MTLSPLCRLSLLCLIFLGCVTLGCGSTEPIPKEVIVYTALDEDFSKPIFAAFTRQTGIEVRAKYDTESTKTVGLANALIAEAERPQCDVFWNNEILQTLRLKKKGLLRKQILDASAEYPAEFRSPEYDWHGFAARARVILVNTNLVPEARRPRSIEDLTDPQWFDRCGIAKPLFGTTATHAACLFEAWGTERAEQFFKRVKSNCRILSGNKRIAQEVASGKLKWGITDTDDAMIEVEAHQPVMIIYPDQPKDETDTEALGTLFIPNTIAIIKDSPNPVAGHALAEFLLTPMVECRLVDGPSAQIPLNRHSNSIPRVKTPKEIKPMAISYDAAADGWDATAKFLAEEFSVAL